MPRTSTLRQRVLLLFVLLAAGPLVAIGVLDYVRARRTVERIIATQTGASVKRVAELIESRYQLLESDIQNLSENAETQRWLTCLPTGDSATIRDARAALDTFMLGVWTAAQQTYSSIEIADTRSVAALTLGGEPAAYGEDALPPVRRPIANGADHAVIGTLVLRPRAPAMLPAQIASHAFGRTGYVMVVDTATSRVLFHSQRSGNAPVADYIGTRAAARLVRGAAADALTLTFTERDSMRVASAALVNGAGWIVLSAAAFPEFSSGMNAARFTDLAVVLSLTLIVAIMFALFMGRSTRPLEELTVAAASVADGNLSPTLPAPGNDEVGVLTRAFDQMLARLRSMVREIEVSRQLAVLGEFSAQLSHEVRNPLTSIKLNLQALMRDVRRGTLPPQAAAPLETSMREVNRLDGVVRGVLALAKPRSPERAPCDLHALISSAMRLHEQRIAGGHMSVVLDLAAERTIVNADAGQITGLLTNLIVNAIEAQPDGGRILVRTRNTGRGIELTIADDGPGIPASVGDRLFTPFATDKATGTGLGLAMALTVAREHGGSLELVDTPTGFRGAAFCLTLSAG
jgi:signal transduction histidine kinase